MDIPIDVTVEWIDGTGGRSTAIILNPITEQVTHVVVREPGLIGVEHLVPIDLIQESSPQRLRLRCTTDELMAMQSFVSSQLIPLPPGYEAYPGAGACYGHMSAPI
jgi:hypothetical protein